ncbi:MAG: FtsQ-type POTRA domain-containing protein [Burkholderiales bacterium]|nr:FtsQ-type POTRA domain-containing protein [Burkholderiales bacterium]
MQLTIMGFFDNVKFINRLAYLVGGLAIAILGFSVVNYAINNWFVVENVVITGNIEHIDLKTLTLVAKEKIRDNLFTLDLDDIQNNFQNIPWVKHVTVMRDFPHSLLIGVDEYSAIARWGNEGLIASDGNIFNGNDVSGELPIFYVAPQNVSEAISDFNMVNAMLAKHNVHLTELNLYGFGITKFVLSNQLNITICGSAVESQIALLNKYWDKLYELNPGLNYVNMCYKNAMAINQATK